MTRNGKIARLPRVVRDTINMALDRGMSGNSIVAWVNEDPDAKEVLKLWFDGKPITKQNLSEWRKGGFKEWLRQQEICDVVIRLTENAKAVDVAGRTDVCAISERLSTVLMVELVSLAQTLLDRTTDTQERWQRLQELFRVLNRVRRGDYHAGKLTLERQQWYVDLAKERSVKNAEKAAMPVVNLMMEEAIHSLMAMGDHYDQRAKDILNNYFRTDGNGSAGPPAETGGEAQSKPVKPSQSQSESVKPENDGAGGQSVPIPPTVSSLAPAGGCK